jgi:hypothetical protein
VVVPPPPHLLTRVFHVILCPLRFAFVMINSLVIICVVQLSITQEAWLGAAATEVVVSIVHITEARGAAIMRLWTHVHIVSLTVTQDAAAPFGTLLINVVSAILLALTAIEPPLALTPPTIKCMLVAPFLGYVSDGGIIDEGGTNSTTITPCRSSNVAIAGMVVVMSLVMSPNGMINMATIVCGGMCAGGGSRDNACGG